MRQLARAERGQCRQLMGAERGQGLEGLGDKERAAQGEERAAQGRGHVSHVTVTHVRAGGWRQREGSTSDWQGQREGSAGLGGLGGQREGSAGRREGSAGRRACVTCYSNTCQSRQLAAERGQCKRLAGAERATKVIGGAERGQRGAWRAKRVGGEQRAGQGRGHMCYALQ